MSEPATTPPQSTASVPALGPFLPPQSRVGFGFVARYALASMSTSLLFLAPMLVALPLKIESLVGTDRAADALAMVTSIGALVSLVANPFFGRLSDRTTSRFGMRRPWMLGGAVGDSLAVALVAVAPNVTVVLIGWALVQLLFNALLAAQVAVLPDHVPALQRGAVSGVLGVCLPLATVVGTFLVQLVAGNEVAMFLLPCAVGVAINVVFIVLLDDRRQTRAGVPPFSPREFLGTFYINPRRSPDFAWVFVGRFLLVFAYAVLLTFQAFYLRNRVGVTEADVPHVIFQGTIAQSVMLVIASLVIGRVSDRTRRRKVFVAAAASTYGLAMLVLATASTTSGYLVGMAISGLGFGAYLAVDLALAVDVLPDASSVGKDLGVLNVAGALPFALAPVVASGVLAVTNTNYSALFALAAATAIGGAFAVVPIRSSR